jgi:isopenicillin N synthase-like dioxygenase
MAPIPVVDLAAAAGPVAPASLLDLVCDATEDVGVIQVVNHGIPLNLIGEFGWRGWRQCPGDDPELRDLALRYLAAGQGLAERVLGLYARALRLPEDTFPVDPLPYLSLTGNDYPTWTYPDSGRDEDTRLPGPVADSVLTVLAQDGGYEGLQVHLPEGEWRPVPAVPGALQVFSGRLLARWTNGRLRPARHRVVGDGPATRRSTAALDYRALGQVLKPLRPFAGPDYLKVLACPAQVTARRELAGTSAGR